MSVFFILVRRDLGSFFRSFSGYLVVTLVALLLGLSFYLLIEGLQQTTSEIPMMEIFYDTPFFWLILLLSSPLITMRSYAQERFSGTYETLMTTAVGDVQVVLAKFTAALVYFMIMWTPLVGCLWVLHRYSMEPPPLDVTQLAVSGVGILLIGAFFMSLGCLASSMTRNQIVAAMVSLSLGVVFFLLSFLPVILPIGAGWETLVANHISMIEHMRDFVRGVVDTRHLVFYLSFTLFFLFLNVKVVEARRWK